MKNNGVEIGFKSELDFSFITFCFKSLTRCDQDFYLYKAVNGKVLKKCNLVFLEID